ncbi:MAG: hypothetical protein U0132_01460 [Gemmatimonadaceae bacterium]
MNASLRDRIVRKIETLSDERGYQVLDYVEFLESKYAERQAASPSIFQRFAEGVEDTLRAGRVSTTAVAETMSLLNRAMGVLSGVAAAGKSVATDIATAATAATKSATGSGTSAAVADTTSPSPESTSSAPKRESESGTPTSTQEST